MTKKDRDMLKLDWKLNHTSQYPPCFDCEKMGSFDLEKPCEGVCWKWYAWHGERILGGDTFEWLMKAIDEGNTRGSIVTTINRHGVTIKPLK